MTDQGRAARAPGEGPTATAGKEPNPAVSKRTSVVKGGEAESFDLGPKALIKLTGVSPELVERAQRIRGRMENPGSLGEILVKMGALTADDLERARIIATAGG